MKLFVDDIHEPPDRTWIVCRSMDTALLLVMHSITTERYNPLIHQLSLDHDMGDGHTDGTKFINTLEAFVYKRHAEGKDLSQVPEILVHSQNCEAGPRMLQAIANIKKWSET